jgi:hypothetical protein
MEEVFAKVGNVWETGGQEDMWPSGQGGTGILKIMPVHVCLIMN